MALPLPDLDNLTYNDLVAEGLALIPTYDPDWTNHNPSDPGITLIELFAWLAEMLIYRANRVPDQHRRVFLKLLNGPEWQPSADLAADIRNTVVDLRKRHRAVTCADYEALVLAAAPDEIARVKCIPRCYLGAATEELRTATKPGYISTIIVPKPSEPGHNNGALQPSPELCQKVWESLEPRRILTTCHHVVGPIYVPVAVSATIVSRADVTELVLDGQSASMKLRQEIMTALENFLSPLPHDTALGWPFGRNIYVSELYELLEAIPGVDYVRDLKPTSQCTAADGERCVAAKEIKHEKGDLIGLALAKHHLPLARLNPAEIVIEQPEPQAVGEKS